MPIDERDLVQMLGNVIHDLKAPLSSMKTLIDGIAEVGELNEKQRYFADRARAKLLTMSQMMSTVLEMAWVGAEHPLSVAPVSLRTLVGHNISMLEDAAAARKIEMRVSIPEDFPTIDADERMVNQIVLNLLANAVKYNIDGGHINVSVREEPDRVVLVIQDTGKGIPAEDQPFVFERFYRARTHSKIEGTGLGLAIVKTAVERHGGEITFVSAIGTGTTFTVTLPRRQPSPDEHPLRSTGEMIRTADYAEGGNSAFETGHGSEPIDAVDDSIQESQDESDEIADSHAEAGRELQSDV